MRRLRLLYCALRGHRFDGWEAAGARPGEPLPFAYCGRCGAEL